MKFLKFPVFLRPKGQKLSVLFIAHLKACLSRKWFATSPIYTKAFENRVYYITCNRVGKEVSEFLGKGVIADPVGQILNQSNGDEEEMLYATLHEDKVLEERAFLPVFIHLRAELYQAIVRRF